MVFLQSRDLSKKKTLTFCCSFLNSISRVWRLLQQQISLGVTDLNLGVK